MLNNIISLLYTATANQQYMEAWYKWIHQARISVSITLSAPARGKVMIHGQEGGCERNDYKELLISRLRQVGFRKETRQ